MTQHIHGYPNNVNDWSDDLLGRGSGDPDMLDKYPGEPDA